MLEPPLTAEDLPIQIGNPTNWTVKIDINRYYLIKNIKCENCLSYVDTYIIKGMTVIAATNHIHNSFCSVCGCRTLKIIQPKECCTPNTTKEPVKLLIGINCDGEFCGNCQHHFSSSSDNTIKANEDHWCEFLSLDLKEQNGKIPRPPECLAAQQQAMDLLSKHLKPS